ncbi:Conserved_hypothetical protein [Hexamita inflata]|uniref:Uncharacterized protein n=1 Tax=Hexamita inflata TaxID=28002 RepID=A0AA86UCI6_9EUKA|nr:Conserved hypothetical protein [Hexamita inflata]
MQDIIQTYHQCDYNNIDSIIQSLLICSEKQAIILLRQCLNNLRPDQPHVLVKSLFIFSATIQQFPDLVNQFNETVFQQFTELFVILNNRLIEKNVQIEIVEAALLAFIDFNIINIPNTIKQTPKFVGLLCNFISQQTELCPLLQTLHANKIYLKVLFSSTQKVTVIQALMHLVLKLKMNELSGLEMLFDIAAELIDQADLFQLQLFGSTESEVKNKIQVKYLTRVLKQKTVSFNYQQMITFCKTLFSKQCIENIEFFEQLQIINEVVLAKIKQDLIGDIMNQISDVQTREYAYQIMIALNYNTYDFIQNEKEKFHRLSVLLKQIYQDFSEQAIPNYVLVNLLRLCFSDMLMINSFSAYFQSTTTPLLADFARRVLSNLFSYLEYRQISGHVQRVLSKFTSNQLNYFADIDFEILEIQHSIQFLYQLTQTQFGRGYSQFNILIKFVFNFISLNKDLVSLINVNRFNLSHYLQNIAAIDYKAFDNSYILTSDQIQTILKGEPPTLQNIYKFNPQLLMSVPFMVELTVEAFSAALDHAVQEENYLNQITVKGAENESDETSNLISTNIKVNESAISDLIEPEMKERVSISDYINRKQTAVKEKSPEAVSSILGEESNLEFGLVFK